MEKDRLTKKFLPMTETAYYILLSLHEPRHGYAIMQHVEALTAGRIRIGAGTIYGTLAKLEKESLIRPEAEIDRKKIYALTNDGRKVLLLEMARLQELLENGRLELGGA